jgi:hypothetical protein
LAAGERFSTTDHSAQYDEACWQTGGQLEFSTLPAPADRFLAAFAPADRCGRGQVLALGTWDVRLDRHSPDTRRFLSRVVTGLATGQASGQHRTSGLSRIDCSHCRSGTGALRRRV